MNRYEYDPSVLDFYRSKLLKILLNQQKTYLYSDSEAAAEYYLFLSFVEKGELGLLNI